jgi:hypothetical protein
MEKSIGLSDDLSSAILGAQFGGEPISPGLKAECSSMNCSPHSPESSLPAARSGSARI